MTSEWTAQTRDVNQKQSDETRIYNVTS